MSSSTGRLRLREGRKDDIPALVRIAIKAFRGRPMSEALFPTQLQTSSQDRDSDVYEFRVGRHLAKIEDKDSHYLVVVPDNDDNDDDDDDRNGPVGLAVWRAPAKPLVAGEAAATPRPEALDLIEKRPKGMDGTALVAIKAGTEKLERNLQDALGEDGYKNAWYLDSLAVDPDHQRRGIGKMLMQWGHDRAAQDHANLRLMASEQGAKLYRSLGYEEVGSVDILGGIEYAFIKKAAPAV